MGSFYSSPSLFEMGESSLAEEGKSAQVLAIEACPKARHQQGASDRSIMPLVVADGPFVTGSSSDELLEPPRKGRWSPHCRDRFR